MYSDFLIYFVAIACTIVFIFALIKRKKRKTIYNAPKKEFTRVRVAKCGKRQVYHEPTDTWVWYYIVFSDVQLDESSEENLQNGCEINHSKMYHDTSLVNDNSSHGFYSSSSRYDSYSSGSSYDSGSSSSYD